MNKKALISVVVIFILSMGFDFLIHAKLLMADYLRFPNVFRTEQDQQAYFPYMLIAHLLIAIGFVWIYNQGKEAKPAVGQGIRFGIAVSILATIPSYLIHFCVLPLSGDVVIKQIVFSTIEVIVLGVVVALLNK
ncbi:MAG TPA: hypothetical protein VFG11_10335 [Acidobacteriota bacterium]|nr:hypothetical protein [Acidobacteriota bacterium]